MSKILDLKISDGSQFQPRCFESIRRYTGNLYHDNHDVPHPLAILNHSWSKVLKAFDSALNEMEAYKPQSVDEAGRNAEPMVDAYVNLIYRAAEFIEDIENNVTLALSASAKKRVAISGSGSQRKIIALPCNKLKHNHHRCHLLLASFAGIMVKGCAIYYVKKGVLTPNTDIYKGRRGTSFNIEFRRIMSAIYFYCDDVAKSIDGLNVPSAGYSSNVIDESTASILTRISGLPFTAMPFESEKDMPVFKFDRQILHLESSGGLVIPGPHGTKMQATFIADGVTKSYAIP